MIQDETSKRVIGAAIAVHRALGPGLLESAYATALAIELERRGIGFLREVPVDITYDSVVVPNAFRADFLVEKHVILELKAVKEVLVIHRAQLRTYLRLTGRWLGLLLNFNVPRMVDGVHRVVSTAKPS